MSVKVVGALTGSSQVAELTRNYDSECEISEKTGGQHAGKPLKKYSVEDDINTLFKAIGIGSSSRGIGWSKDSEHYRRDALHKSAMRKPIRHGRFQVSGIGITESVNLKQALRGLCISQASELAVLKKRMSKSSAAPGVSEAVTIKRLYGAVVNETSESGQLLEAGKGNMVEISLVPESSLSNMSDEISRSECISLADIPERSAQTYVLPVGARMHTANMTKMMTKKEITPISSSVGSALSASESGQNRTSESSFSSIPNKKLPLLDEGSVTAIRERMKHVDNLQSESYTLTSSLEGKLIKPSSKARALSKRSLRSKCFVKRKVVPTKPLVSQGLNKQNNGVIDGHYTQSSKMDWQTPDSVVGKGCEKSEKVSLALASTADVVLDSIVVDYKANKHVPVPHSFSKLKSAVTIADVKSSVSREKVEVETSQSSRSTIGECSSTSYSEESSLSGSSHSSYWPHMSKDLRWEAMHYVWKQRGSLGMRDFKLLRELGGGDIGTVYLSELIGTSCLFSVKVMDRDTLTSRKNMLRAQTEKEILEILHHPFLPTLYGHFTTNKFTCLVTEYCPGDNLHVLRQKQLTKSFPEQAARFYVAEVLLALEYLHMLGVVYRDLKPEKVLIREDGHIMLSDFDLSLRCATNTVLLKSSSPAAGPPKTISSPCSDSNCLDPFCLQSCLTPKFSSAASKTRKTSPKLAAQVIPLSQLVVEPTVVRSNSFVGEYEYPAPEIIKGEGYGSAVDWWTLGILLFELLYGRTPFKGSSDEDALSNVVSQCLEFPQCPTVSSHARDLITRLLQNEAENRLGSSMGAAEIKQHPFFEGLNWALIRCKTPPELPKLLDLGNLVPETTSGNKIGKYSGNSAELEMF